MNARTLSMLFTLILVPMTAAAVLPEKPTRDPADGILVKYRDGISATAMNLHADSAGIVILPRPGATGARDPRRALGKLVVGERDLERSLAELNAHPLVEYAEPNYRRHPHIIPLDTRYAEQWVMPKMDMPTAWNTVNDASAVRIAIIDDGVSSTHTDLAANVIPGACFGDATFCAGDSTAGNPQDGDDHGTAVAGQAGAVGNNNEGITGTAWTVEIMPLRTDLTVDNIKAAIDHAIAENVDIINASFGGASFSQTEYDAVATARDAGILFVTSAGNSHTDNDKGLLSFPQTFDLDNVLTVAASDQADQLTTWAQYGQTTVDVTAGGVGILSTRRSGGYQTYNGSSFASPLVAGIAALIKAAYPAADYREMKARIVGGADMPADSALRARVAGGRANGRNAVDPATPDGVLLVSGVSVDDELSGGPNRDNAALDAGETANLQIALQNLFGAASNIDATLSLPNAVDGSKITIENTMAHLGDIPPGDHGTLVFPVRVADGLTGNHRVLFRLDLEWNGGKTVTRWFEYELGLLTPNTTHVFVAGRAARDNYHAYHIDVPAGVTGFRIDTETQDEYDIDLLARYRVPPKYQITLNEGPDSDNATFAYSPREPEDDPANPYVVEISGRFDGNEVLTWDAPDPGVYHLVIVNYGLAQRTYKLSTSWCTNSGCAGRARFASAEIVGQPSQNSMTISVVRDGGATGAASVRYRVANGGNAVSGTDFTPVSGNLQWTDGDSDPKTFQLPISSTRTPGRTVVLELHDPAGFTLVAPSWTTATLPARPATTPPPGGGGGGGGGGSLPWWLVAGLAGLALARRRQSA